MRIITAKQWTKILFDVYDSTVWFYQCISSGSGALFISSLTPLNSWSFLIGCNSFMHFILISYASKNRCNPLMLINYAYATTYFCDCFPLSHSAISAMTSFLIPLMVNYSSMHSYLRSGYISMAFWIIFSLWRTSDIFFIRFIRSVSLFEKKMVAREARWGSDSEGKGG